MLLLMMPLSPVEILHLLEHLLGMPAISDILFGKKSLQDMQEHHILRIFQFEVFTLGLSVLFRLNFAQ
jgi:hypothetical protein